MNTNEIPLIICNFNQLTFTRNLVNWFSFYYPENPIWIIDNASDYEPLLKWYTGMNVAQYKENDFIGNLKNFLNNHRFDYYIISDPDIMPHPSTPPDFLSYFKAVVDGGYHRCGFDLIWQDIPEWNPKKGWIQGDQRGLIAEPVDVHGFTGKKAPIDTTFCLYKASNGGWSAPMPGNLWGSSVRLFDAFHLTWYLHKDYLNEEMIHYFSTVKKRDITKPSAGRNHFNPYNGIHD